MSLQSNEGQERWGCEERDLPAGEFNIYKEF